MIQINDKLAKKAFDCAKAHGFHDTYKPFLHYMMLIITEIGEVVQADRKDRHSDVARFKLLQEKFQPKGEKTQDKFFIMDFEKYIKDSVEDELSDVIIRCMDLAGLNGYSIDGVDEDVPKYEDLTGRIWNMTEYMAHVISFFYFGQITNETRIKCVISSILMYCDKFNIDILFHIEQKMRYNELRPKLNGKKY